MTNHVSPDERAAGIENRLQTLELSMSLIRSRLQTIQASLVERLSTGSVAVDTVLEQKRDEAKPAASNAGMLEVFASSNTELHNKVRELQAKVAELATENARLEQLASNRGELLNEWEYGKKLEPKL